MRTTCGSGERHEQSRKRKTQNRSSSTVLPCPRAPGKRPLVEAKAMNEDEKRREPGGDNDKPDMRAVVLSGFAEEDPQSPAFDAGLAEARPLKRHDDPSPLTPL